MKSKQPMFKYPATTQWWTTVTSGWVLESHHMHLLRLACQALDRAEEARLAIEAAGSLTFTDNHGNVKPRPEVQIENIARIAFARLLRELDLDAEPPGERSRPPAVRSNRG